MEIDANSGSDDWDIAAAKAVLDDANSDRNVVSPNIVRPGSSLLTHRRYQDVGDDQGLIKYRPQYIAQGHVHLALASHRAPNTKADFTLHAEQAVSLLSTLIPRPPRKVTDGNLAQKQKRTGECRRYLVNDACLTILLLVQLGIA